MKETKQKGTKTDQPAKKYMIHKSAYTDDEPKSKAKKKRLGFVEIKTQGKGMDEVSGHSSVLDDNSGILYIFGGFDSEGGFLSDLFLFNIETNTWTQFEGNVLPPGRHFHSAVLHEGAMYIFGGTSNGYYNDFYRFHLDSLRWTLISDYEGTLPSPRYGHTAVIHNNCMYVYGGFDKDGFICNDVHSFNFKSSKWKKLSVTYANEEIALSCERYHHSAVVHQGAMYIFGGFHRDDSLLQFHFASRTWCKIATYGVQPRARWGHRTVAHKGAMYLFGGVDSVKTFTDLYTFHFESSYWRRVSSSEPGRAFHSFDLCPSRRSVFLFGGRNTYHFNFNELFELRMNDRKAWRDGYSSDFKALVNNPIFSDLRFTFPTESKVIYAHRNVIVARCEMLAVMLRSGLREDRSGEIIISTFSYDAFLVLVEYLYTGKSCASSEDVLEVLRISDVYQVLHLKALCEERARKFVDMTNVLDILKLADQLSAHILKGYCLHYIVINWNEWQSEMEPKQGIKKKKKMHKRNKSEEQQEQSAVQPSSPRWLCSLLPKHLQEELITLLTKKSKKIRA
eukprot:TRINITY_DN17977_c0_g1_i1.p1 TRINITY_DN17977_c0_g1~~TRINITY_DN17977_c0_g1_i1.p1  ORF type:complete len:564 (-),score=55.74 TRINITY_DN17977_c0_g1_i1:87-1778(-)